MHQVELLVSTKKKDTHVTEEDLKVTEIHEHSPLKKISNSGRQIRKPKICFGEASRSTAKRHSPGNHSIHDKGMPSSTTYMEDKVYSSTTNKKHDCQVSQERN